MSEDIITEEVQEEQETQENEVVETTPKYTQEEDAAYIKKLKKENEKYRKDFAKKLKEEEEAKKLALEEQGKYKELYEQTQKEAEATKFNLEETNKRNALMLALRDSDANNPELLEQLFKSEGKFNFELDNNNKIIDLENLMNPIKEKYAAQFGKQIKKGVDPKRGKNDPDLYGSKEEIAALSEKEWVANLDKIKKSLKQWE